MSDAYLPSTACYLLKGPPKIGRHGQVTQAQREILRALARGLTRNQIAEERRVSQNTVSTQLATLYQLFDAHHQVGLLVAAVKAGLVTIGREA